MTHTRIRKFNTKDTYPEQKLDNDLCQAVAARGTMVFVRGQVGQDLDTAKSVCGEGQVCWVCTYHEACSYECRAADGSCQPAPPCGPQTAY